MNRKKKLAKTLMVVFAGIVLFVYIPWAIKAYPESIDNENIRGEASGLMIGYGVAFVLFFGAIGYGIGSALDRWKSGS